MRRVPVRSAITSVALVAVAGVVVFAVLHNDFMGSQARAAYAEYLAVGEARDRAAAQLKAASELAAAVPEEDRPLAEPAVRAAKAVMANAADHAHHLENTWDARWRRMGLKP